MKMISHEGLPLALAELDREIPVSVELLIGGGGALVALYGETEATHDLDAVPIRSKLSFDELKPYLFRVAEKLDLPKDWVNPYFQSFTHVLPSDYLERTREIFQGERLRCIGLGPEDLLIMKFMAGRQKDDRHIRRLLKRNDVDLKLVEQRLDELAHLELPRAKEALDRLDEMKSDLEIA